MNNFPAISWWEPITYRLMHAFFHIRTVIIPRDRYQAEGFSPRVDNGRVMIAELIWKRACINQFITYFNIELKRTKLTSHTDTKLMDMSDRYRLRDNSSDMETSTNLSSLDADLCQTKIDSWAEVTTWGSWEAWYRVISVFPWYLPMGWYRCGTSGVYVWTKLTLLLINMW
jgi:hypothetical protein